jgi:hypothetical protein
VSNILLIEPFRILQQAIALSLASEHQVEIRATINPDELRSVTGRDLVILDASALYEKHLLTADMILAIEGCGMPVIWLEDESTAERPDTTKLRAVRKPLEPKALKDAIYSLLADRSCAKGVAVGVEAKVPRPTPVKRKEGKQTSGAAEQSSFEFIDLIDVVGELPAEGAGKRSEREN